MRKTLLASLVLLTGAMVVAGLIFHVLHPPAADNSPGSKGASSHAATGALAVASTSKKPPVTTDHHEEGKSPAAPVWAVDKEASRLTFKGVMNGVPFDGVFRDWDAQIAFDPHNLKASRATITVNTASALTGQPIKDQALPNSEWLSTARFPTATLVTRQIVQTGPGRYQAAADLHIRGVAWRTTVPFVVIINHDSGRMQSTLTLDRRTFGIGEGPFKSPPPVAPAVQVTLRMVAKKTR